MQLDLRAYQVSDLEILCDPGLSREEFEQIRASLPEDALTEGRVVRHCDYRVGRRRYHELAILAPRAEDRHWLAIHASSGGEPGTGAGSVGELLEAIAPLSRTATLNCEVGFTYPSRRWSSSIRLPLRLSEWGQAFDEVQGVRVVKVSADGDLEYSAILDRPRKAEYVLSLTFAYESAIEPSMPQRVVLEAARISALLIRPRGGG